jgi:hypothetical protein
VLSSLLPHLLLLWLLLHPLLPLPLLLRLHLPLLWYPLRPDHSLPFNLQLILRLLAIMRQAERLVPLPTFQLLVYSGPQMRLIIAS